MKRKKRLPGSSHSALLGRDEPAVFDSISNSELVEKVIPLRVSRRSTRNRCLTLRSAQAVGLSFMLIEGWLTFPSEGGRELRIYPTAGVTLAALRENLASDLARHRVEVELSGREIMHQHSNGLAKQAMSEDDLWALCQVIAEEVRQAGELEEQEAELQSQLEEVRSKREQVRLNAIGAVRQL